MNYWYRAFIVVNESTLELVSKMPSSYAAMSHFEFFAELYALYYDMDDPLRENIPDSVTAWLAENIGSPDTISPEIMTPSPVPPGELPEWHWINRPNDDSGVKLSAEGNQP